MKQIILPVVIMLATIVATAQTNSKSPSANYEAANWKTRLLDNPGQITITAPPTVAQSKA